MATTSVGGLAGAAGSDAVVGERQLAAADSPPASGGGPKAIIFDVDGVVSPVGDAQDPANLPWRDEAVSGTVFGPVLVSPTLASRLDELHRPPGVTCWWLTSWTSEMRAAMSFFPGRRWPVLAEPDPARLPSRGWWKLAAMEAWLDSHPEVSGVAWCDDDLRGGLPGAVQRRLAARDMRKPLLIAPKTSIGLTPRDVDRLQRWATSPIATRTT